MKRFGFITFAVLTAVFSSCNDSDGDYASSWAFASAETLNSNDYYFVLDDNKTVYPSDKSRVAGYKPEDDQRVIIFFNLLKTGVEGYDYNIALYDARNIYTGAAAFGQKSAPCGNCSACRSGAIDKEIPNIPRMTVQELYCWILQLHRDELHRRNPHQKQATNAQLREIAETMQLPDNLPGRETYFPYLRAFQSHP